MNIELIPVLEIPITAKARLQAIQRPLASFQQNPFEWDEYQRQLLVVGGFSDYQCVIQGCNFVCVDQWSLPDLRLLVQNHLDSDGTAPIPLAESCALFGGCILIVDGVPVLVPQCCSTIADFSSWEDLLEPQFTAGPFCLEGHPGPEAVKNGVHLLITCEDPDEAFDQPAQSRVVVPIEDLANATERARQLMQAFADRIDLLSAELGVAKASDYIVWGNQ
ncbi:hypothetical protein [Hymenobacter negativus]|uniref:SMI1/KNR4 family protein n=1 Tax=Hymenobacter negativus TaxID=2795026 RepID=A0ABS3QFC4_9BACT|nr:hypothetical protein [Hymenobacter negativus]MBO2009801.1 hypothetical protein [Hymenobacter negativus]